MDRDPIMQFFTCDGVPLPSRLLAEEIGELAEEIVRTVPRSAERTVALRKLLETRDALMRAVIVRDA